MHFVASLPCNSRKNDDKSCVITDEKFESFISTLLIKWILTELPAMTCSISSSIHNRLCLLGSSGCSRRTIFLPISTKWSCMSMTAS
ncbi:hypothetical protein Hanom_Chr00s000003g01605881 [Helianthus anomalus]